MSTFFSVLIKEILSLKDHSKNLASDRHLLQVLLDQLIIAAKYKHYTPTEPASCVKNILTALSLA